ncbi:MULTISPECIES: sigma-70 family RNA polymerase sigma factor [Micromonospora]|uniref:Sigma-70 family RNA polymerase sigma factor n=1 Tax=Micromonospora solifontis TaxID=2487138 RepID=A0ABX9WIT7_9ACTN|nr:MULTISPECIES: sigma-70 family RNA polymerase sigma factor [Micromonospora]NES13562.1 sigma-70 family RNA polymerase sigma factor [Micromonospora sp. PPF5-17B]NES37264.1 sigma-70 family RNA polymerase sigma factor [Micromonospora solifontis]NES55472.1 sigma-70 family RNA polymerase sigma factor [Micromonospora sp. PPF5-6]RNL98498.1 sigma-70 family RNA polymerase sigma factor [Micromonospora solifontis]
MTAEADDDQVTRWAQRAARGDQQAAAAFVRALQGPVWRFLAHLAGPGEADDLAQDTFLRALRSLPGFAGRSSARTWVFTIARRVAVDHVRAATARPRTAALPDWQSAAEAAGAVIAGSDDTVTLRRLVAALAPERREAFVATQIVGLSYAEAAEVCGCPVGTIRSRVARAREDLIAAWQDGSRPARGARVV